MTNATLAHELEFFKAHQDELVGKYLGRYLVIKDQVVVGDYESEMDAYASAKAKYEMGTFLIQHCLPGTEPYTQTFHSRVLVG